MKTPPADLEPSPATGSPDIGDSRADDLGSSIEATLLLLSLVLFLLNATGVLSLFYRWLVVDL